MKTVAASQEDTELADFLKAAGDPHRLQILRMLQNGERCVCEIHEPLCLPQNLASHHLKALRDARLVKTRRDGRKIIYSLNAARFKIIAKLIDDMAKCEGTD
ncbi:MAG: metalloregulator ArsR/SmtB family transcription factor [Actinomycetota bacterium]